MSINCTNCGRPYMVALYNEKQPPHLQPTTRATPRTSVRDTSYVSACISNISTVACRERPDIPKPVFQTQHQGKHTLNNKKTDHGTF